MKKIENKAIEKEYDLLLRIFGKYYDSYEEMLNRAKNVEQDTVIWSDSFLEFFPYQNALNQLKKPKIYKTEPESNEGVIVNKLKDGELYYSYDKENKGWGSVFVIKEDGMKLYLRFLNNDNDEIVLEQVYCVVLKETVIEKVLFYLKDVDLDGDEELNEETFLVDEYLYNSNQAVDTIIRNGFYHENKNSIPTTTFRFEYVDEGIFIYSKQMKQNQVDVEQLRWKIKKS
ncbi:hypothetical protein PAALTS15_03517 [Paenibacillus alvei TS-15]|uniref:Uncharacterized protein n=1 Tax=Paenibacillus alvei TS-15 TaxID=1117108 RepID=S9U271_PAEAL|nr:hypothetical protein [Paenibacillus alvei]EPY08611.1 hypothetical protein PAALTS15_03517 [Paenibacillus alvei TS-15]